MKSILFDKGKLYVIELPQLMDFEYRGRHLKFKEAYAAALANKVEVKNPELISLKTKLGDFHTIHPYLEKKGQKLKDGDNFPIPPDLTFDKETGMLKRTEPENPEESQEQLFEFLFFLTRTGRHKEAIEKFTIQRKKS